MFSLDYREICMSYCFTSFKFLFKCDHPTQGFPGGSDDKRVHLQCGRSALSPWVGRHPEGGHGNPLQYSCLENPHQQRCLAGYSPRGHKELDTTDTQHTAHTTHIPYIHSFLYLPLQHLLLPKTI